MRRPIPGSERGRATAATLALLLLAAGCGTDATNGADASQDAAHESAQLRTSPASEASPAPGTTRTAEAGGTAGTSNAPARKQDAPTTHPSGTELTTKTFADLVIGSFTRGGTAKVEMRTSEGGTSARGVIDFRTTPSSMRLVTTIDAVEGQQTEVILVQDAMYMNMGQVSQGKYLRMPLTHEDALLTDLSQLDPVSSFTEYAKAIESVTVAGPENVEGEPLQRYVAHVDSAKLLGERAETSELPARITHTVWFDAKGRVRRVEVDMGRSGTSTMTYRDWGKKVAVKAPPASKVMDMPTTPEQR